MIVLSSFYCRSVLLSLSPGPDINNVMALGSAKFRPTQIVGSKLVLGLLVHTVVVLGLAEFFHPSIVLFGHLYLIF